MAKNKYQSDAADSVAVVEEEITVPATAAAEVPSVPEAAAVVLRFRVTVGDKSDVISAPNAADAWALYCDKNKTWPNPNTCGRSVEQVK